jgi:hypothetical protein
MSIDRVETQLALLVSDLKHDRCFPDSTDCGFSVTHHGTTWEVRTVDDPGMFTVTRHGESQGVWDQDRLKVAILR